MAGMPRALVAVILTIAGAPWIVSAQGRGGPARPREIVQIRGNLYYVSGSEHRLPRDARRDHPG
jgi:hypothetical protein